MPYAFREPLVLVTVCLQKLAGHNSGKFIDPPPYENPHLNDSGTDPDFQYSNKWQTRMYSCVCTHRRLMCFVCRFLFNREGFHPPPPKLDKYITKLIEVCSE